MVLFLTVLLPLAHACFPVSVSQFYTDPTLTLTFHPPVAWTFPNSDALGRQAAFPGQPLAKMDADSIATGIITTAVQEALTAKGFSLAQVRPTIAYTPPEISGCSMNGSTAINATIGKLDTTMKTVVSLGKVVTAIDIADCVKNDLSKATFEDFVQTATVTLRGLSTAETTLTDVASKLQSLLEKKNAEFTEDITFKGA